ncbi:hypothetical protein Tco_0876236 [Tanacetum coccineum]|uniref:Uncharacterized protein n=1 Tax=Tanacetum coccineum TaxID=301880 RepID=A0ABQ5BRQ3_9ASTR
MKSKKKNMKNLIMDIVNQDVGVFPLRNWIDFGFEGWILWFLCGCVRYSSNRGRGKSEIGCLVMDLAEDKGSKVKSMLDKPAPIDVVLCGRVVEADVVVDGSLSHP